ncbi:MAG: tRNA preQ1(34) S-adenosylmethionine ribosyltransferase-isomerase QueA [Caldisericia bacterium]|nr:tRNA preQ1(34) S-adenosylmethionine ribosyltransferase-isomerase QueA [Caldisericia bacterium]
MKTSDFYFDLPQELIAQTPSIERENARMMVLNKKTDIFEHKYFSDLPSYLQKGDVLVLNNTKVIPARLFMTRKDTGGKVEILLIRPKTDNQWMCFVTPGKKARPGMTLTHASGILEGKVISILENGERIIEFNWTSDKPFLDMLKETGKTPLPPYIKSDPDTWKEYYQTVYAQHDGSVAAPTAGLHFTNTLLEKIKNMGVKVVEITLHVGPGTFKPVKATEVKDHRMDFESYIISEESADIINRAKDNGNRCFGVGTTVTRTLESCAQNGKVIPSEADTNLFITPGYKYQIIDGLITNFHLPESTLIMLVSALYNREKVLEAYNEAILKEYRFYSFGDAMLVL